jgi:hypothetical protein
MDMVQGTWSNELEASGKPWWFQSIIHFLQLYRNPKVMYSKFMHTTVSGSVLNPL